MKIARLLLGNASVGGSIEHDVYFISVIFNLATQIFDESSLHLAKSRECWVVVPEVLVHFPPGFEEKRSEAD
jgi:hypothetical protein